MRKCSNCVHYITKLKDTPAHCRAVPPVVAQGAVSFSVPLAHWWCGMHRFRFSVLVEWLRGQFVLDRTVVAS